jgi:hypothetical protein
MAQLLVDAKASLDIRNRAGVGHRELQPEPFVKGHCVVGSIIFSATA